MTADIDKVFPASDAINAFQRRIIAGLAGALPFVYIAVKEEIISFNIINDIDFYIVSIVSPGIVFTIYAIGFVYETILFRAIIPGAFFCVNNIDFPYKLYKLILDKFNFDKNYLLLAALFIFMSPIFPIYIFLILPFGLLGLQTKPIYYKYRNIKNLVYMNSSRLKVIEITSLILISKLTAAQAKYVNDSINALKSNAVYASILGQLAMIVAREALMISDVPTQFEGIPFLYYSVIMYLFYTVSGLFAFYPYKSDLRALILSIDSFYSDLSDQPDAP